MPEYSEVYTVARDLQMYLGEEILSVKGYNTLRFPNLNLKSNSLLDIIRYGKLIQVIISSDTDLISLYRYEKPYKDSKNFSLTEGKISLLKQYKYKVLNIHLGMTGQLSTSPPDINQRFCINFHSAKSLFLKDNRMFGRVYLSNDFKIPGFRDPLHKDFYNFLIPEVSSSTQRIFDILLNQNFFLGVGSYLAQESLYRSRISPFLRNLTDSQYQILCDNLKEIIRSSNKARGASISDYFDLHGKRGRFQSEFMVYQRSGQPCFTCGNSISRGNISSRGVYYCSFCQS